MRNECITDVRPTALTCEPRDGEPVETGQQLRCVTLPRTFPLEVPVLALRSPQRSTSLLVAAVSALVLVSLTLAPTAASAHDHLLSSSPKSGATLQTLPKSVILHFEEPPAAGYTKVRVVNAGGRAIGNAAPSTTGSTVTLALPASSATGGFMIVWSALSDDGHPVSGTIGFRVAPKAKGTTVAPATSQAAATTHLRRGSELGWLAAVAIGVAVLASLFVLLGRRDTTR